MDNAVALTQAYLYLNGYFTVTEYPVFEPTTSGSYQVVTDIDLVALRLPRSGGPITASAKGSAFPDSFVPDSELRSPHDHPDMIIAEVKEGTAELNAGALNPEVLSAVLLRFGACTRTEIGAVVKDLLQLGRAKTSAELGVRLIAFGSVVRDREPDNYTRVSLAHVIWFLEDYIRRHWPLIHTTKIGHPAFGNLVLLEKTRRAAQRTELKTRART